MNAPGKRGIAAPIAASVAFVLELALVPLLLPVMQQKVGLSVAELAWVFNAYGIAVAAGVLAGGWIGDRLNPRIAFATGALLFAVASVCIAFCDITWCLIAGRAIQGFGGGVFSPLVPILLTRAAPRRPGRVLVLWGSITGYVAAFAPLLYTYLYGGESWHEVFLVFAVIAVVAIAVLPWRAPPVQVTPSLRPSTEAFQLIRSSRLAAMYAYVFCTYGAITFYLFRLPVLLVENGLPALTISVTVSLIWLSFSTCSTLLRNRVDESQLRTILFAAPVLIAIGFPLATAQQTLPALLLSAIFIGAGLACSNAPSTQVILEIAPPRMQAFSVSLDITFARLGGVATVALLASAGFMQSILAVAAMSVVAMICLSFAGIRQRRTA